MNTGEEEERGHEKTLEDGGTERCCSQGKKKGSESVKKTREFRWKTMWEKYENKNKNAHQEKHKVLWIQQERRSKISKIEFIKDFLITFLKQITIQ